MHVLVDTSVFIDRENYHILPKHLKDLSRVLNTLRAEIMVHPRSVEEIRRDGNAQRKRISLSKIRTYPLLESPPELLEDDTFPSAIGMTRRPIRSLNRALLGSEELKNRRALCMKGEVHDY